jgi:cyclophilin family peptidyl-prolyl cis-trans isomerase
MRSGYHIKGEFAQNGVSNPIQHKRGVISMARSGHPDSAGSQFFIMHADGRTSTAYAAFGHVFEAWTLWIKSPRPDRVRRQARDAADYREPSQSTGIEAGNKMGTPKMSGFSGKRAIRQTKNRRAQAGGNLRFCPIYIKGGLT